MSDTSKTRCPAEAPPHGDCPPSADQNPAAGQRISVRLPGDIALRVEEMCRAEGRSVTAFVIAALRQALGTERHSQPSDNVARQAGLPAYLEPLARQFQGFGIRMAAERRQRLEAALALAWLVHQNTGDPRDAAVFRDLLGLLRKYSLLQTCQTTSQR